ncbi:MAG: ribonuclease HII [Alphaproteobacteria bacterium]|nr:ribonuclease HII [Alphaproteobacteria bacterium]
MPDFFYEISAGGLVAGLDEAGRGPWAGPVVAAAVIFPNYKLPDLLYHSLDDSKKLSHQQREKLYHPICDYADIGIGIAKVHEIDQINILQASLLAMKRALNNLSLDPDFILVDGIHLPFVPVQGKTLIKGDSLSFSIAAASIVAKVVRDRLMTQLSKEFPYYNWAQNKGYGTAEHHQAIKQYGVCDHHRHSFRPISEIINLTI